MSTNRLETMSWDKKLTNNQLYSVCLTAAHVERAYTEYKNLANHVRNAEEEHYISQYSKPAIR